jgi:hypothetical protein
MATIGSTTLGEILPSTMGATTLDAVAGVVSPRTRRSLPRRPMYRAPTGQRRVAGSPRTLGFKDRIGAASAELKAHRELVKMATAAFRIAEREKKAAERKLETLQRKLAATRAAATAHAARKREAAWKRR